MEVIKFLKRALFLFLLCYTLQSCWIIVANRSWDGGSINNHKRWDFYNPKYFKIKDSNINSSVGISRKPIFFPLPFLFIFFDISKNYELSFSFDERIPIYNTIDSVFYQIYNDKDSLLLTGKLISSSQSRIFKVHVFKGIIPMRYDFVKRMHIDTNIIDTGYSASIHTGYDFKIPFKENENEMKINWTLYSTTRNNRVIKFDYSCRLLKALRGIGFFQV
jgi:hypothetical protein